MTDPDLVRFVEAQASVYARVVEELTAGNKRTHWMWFIFPQIAGLGHSSMAERYAIRDLDQAKRYLDDPTLGKRLRHDLRLMLRHKGRSAQQILGSLDDVKFRSCLTLFARAALTDVDRCCLSIEFRKIVLLVTQVIGAARVHRWTLPYRPRRILL